ncbi:hypothetical protein F444_11221 [Phytophthora nicotianae P1976]|uniref:Uncharacterized protein n=1 Tax=Phytophthora nicotianae P1976 TaxID=1317066 RepID=A0A081A1K6_PHYNI|nr:hypothetical protein F444_11221 [Phytophthora nicotianae P1976]
MARDAYRRGGLIKSAARVQEDQERQESTWTLTQVEEIIRRERAVRQQAQLAAEQALKAAKEAQKVILQLEEELDIKEKLLQQERAARQQAELAAQKAAIRAVVEDTTDKTIAVIRTEEKSLLKSNAVVRKREDEADSAKLPQPKRAREIAKEQSASPTKKLKVKEKSPQDKTSPKKMSLAEARKAAREEVERRAQQRAKALEDMKKNEGY